MAQGVPRVLDDAVPLNPASGPQSHCQSQERPSWRGAPSTASATPTKTRVAGVSGPLAVRKATGAVHTVSATDASRAAKQTVGTGQIKADSGGKPEGFVRQRKAPEYATYPGPADRYHDSGGELADCQLRVRHTLRHWALNRTPWGRRHEGMGSHWAVPSALLGMRPAPCGPSPAKELRRGIGVQALRRSVAPKRVRRHCPPRCQAVPGPQATARTSNNPMHRTLRQSLGRGAVSCSSGQFGQSNETGVPPRGIRRVGQGHGPVVMGARSARRTFSTRANLSRRSLDNVPK